MIVVHGENYVAQRYKRIDNSDYEWEDAPDITFRCRPASQMERKNYRIQKGVEGGSDSIYIICSNLPTDIKDRDKIYFMGKMWTIQSIGYYFDSNRLVNPNIMSEEYIINRCPKGISIQ